MKNTTYSNEKMELNITFDDMLKATKKIKPFPIKRLDVGKGILKAIKKLEKQSKQDYKKNFKYVGSLYGIEIRLDKTLKPNQYRVIKNLGA